MIDHLEESIMIGTRAMSGSAAIRLRNSTMAFSESIRPSSMLTSMICAPFATWSRATSSAAEKSPAVISFLNFAEPVTLVRSPTLTKGISLVSVKGSSPESRISGAMSGTTRGGMSRTASAIARMCSGVEPQQPPTTFSSPSSAKPRSCAAIASGLWSYCPNSFGRPAFG